MKKVLLLLMCLMALASCHQNGVKQPKNLQLAPSEEQLVLYCNDFSFNLLAQVANNETKENIILSPLSASMLLGMLMNGADGATLAQIRAVVGFENNTSIASINDWYRQLIDVLPELDQYTKVNIANGMWVREDFPVSDAFVQACKQNFDAQVKNVPDFSDKVLDDINRFAAQQTNDRIKKVMDPSMVNEFTVMALLNALYFKAVWKDKFEKSQTSQQNFTTLGGTQLKTDMMHNTKEWRYGETDEYQFLELLYKGDKYCADIVLPTKGMDIREWAKSLNAERWKQMCSRLSMPEVSLALPKFSLSYDRSLSDDLKSLGMKDAFGKMADFSHLSKEPTFVSLIKQYTFVQVDEEGTEAAAVTVGLMEKNGISEHKNFVADRPFLFVIRERTYGTILFTAIIGQPEWQK